MNILSVNSATIKKAAGILQSGGLVAFPTETVYGLGGDATNDLAVAAIFSAKGRPQFNPLIVHVSNIAMAQQFVIWNGWAEKLAAQFCPGPLTFILPRLPGSKISLLASAGGDTIGIRIPAHPVARQLLVEANLPIAAPSANRSGRVSPTAAQHVYEELGDVVPMILDGGGCNVGIESTVIDLSGDEIILLRPGIITREQIEECLGIKISTLDDVSGVLKSPGLLASHYAPSLPVRLNVVKPNSDEAYLAFGPDVPAGAKKVLNLSPVANLKEAAARLFSGLRELDNMQEYSAIAVMPIPDTGIGIAINDRLRRAEKR